MKNKAKITLTGDTCNYMNNLLDINVLVGLVEYNYVTDGIKKFGGH